MCREVVAKVANTLVEHTGPRVGPALGTVAIRGAEFAEPCGVWREGGGGEGSQIDRS